MWRLFIFLVLVMFKPAESLPDKDSLNFPEITFTIESRKDNANVSHLICDHNYTRSIQHYKYTVLEGQKFKIITKHNSEIIHFYCGDLTNMKTQYHYELGHSTNVFTFVAEKNMGTLWNCTVLSDRDVAVGERGGMINTNRLYSAAYCYMQIHVRQTNPPQTILVNNVALQAVRTDLSVKDVDFTAEYQYADGDVVQVACVNFLSKATLTMEYPMADTLSDKFNSTSLSSREMIVFSTKLHSGYDNSYMICNGKESNDYSKVMVRFVMRTEFNIVRIKINGMTLRPKLTPPKNNQYQIEYKYMRNVPIKVECEVERADVELVVTDSGPGFVGKVNSYKKTSNSELLPLSCSEMSFHLDGEANSLSCSADYFTGASAEINIIQFSKGNFNIDQYPLKMELLPNSAVTELLYYSYEKSHVVIFYEFKDDERLQLKCGPFLPSPQPGPILYLKFKDFICEVAGCYLFQHVTATDLLDNSEIKCGLMEKELYRVDKVFKEIKVIFRKTLLATTSTTTTTTSTTTSTATTTTTTSTTTTTPTTVQPTDDQRSTKPILAYSLSAVGVVLILLFVVLLLLHLKAQKRCCYRSRAQELPLPRPDPASVYYENMLSVFAPINEREAEAMENHYEEIL